MAISMRRAVAINGRRRAKCDGNQTARPFGAPVQIERKVFIRLPHYAGSTHELAIFSTKVSLQGRQRIGFRFRKLKNTGNIVMPAPRADAMT